MIIASELNTELFTDSHTVRLIADAYINEPAMSPLADNEQELEYLSEIEGLTSSRLKPIIPVPGGLHPDELMTESYGYGWTYINAAFCHTRPTGNRFNDGNRGAWYAAYGNDCVETAKLEVAWHLTQELIAIDTFDNLTIYRELIAGFTTSFHSLLNCEGTPELHEDKLIAYPAGQALARQILSAGGNGLIYPSARNPNGTCLVALRPSLIQNIRTGDKWAFEWSDSPVANIYKASS